MPYYVGRVVDDADHLVARTPEAFRERNIDARVHHEVTGIDVADRRVRVRRVGGGPPWWEPFDQLLIATGAVPIRPDVQGAELGGIYGVSTLQSGIELRRAVDDGQPERAVIAGGGYVGLEMAEALLRRGVSVSIVEKMPQVMSTLDPDMGGHVADALLGAGIDLYLEESVQAFEGANDHVGAVVTDRRTLPADLVVLGMGVQPNSALASEAGLLLGARGSIVVNERMQTSADGVWAAGDCAQSLHVVSRRPFYVALGTVANKQGRVAGVNIGGGYATFPGVVGTALTRFGDLEIARTGLQAQEVERLGWSCASAVIQGRTRSRHYPGGGAITVKVLAERGSGRLLGGQIVGAEGSGKRIDVLATALHAGMDVREMINLDLGYAPPYSPVWDPVLIAVRQASKLVERG